MQKHFSINKPTFLINTKYGFSRNTKELNSFTKNHNLSHKFKLNSNGKYPEAILFDCDGVLVDTEKDGHRVAFNEAFKQKSIFYQISKIQFNILRFKLCMGCRTLWKITRNRRRQRTHVCLFFSYKKFHFLN